MLRRFDLQFQALPSKLRHLLTSAISTFLPLKIVWELWELDAGQQGRETSMLIIVLCCPHKYQGLVENAERDGFLVLGEYLSNLKVFFTEAKF